ncbi:e8efd19c-7341-4ced-b006-7e6c30f09fd3 [Sclerotinia trifoliorum]|uniref:E8efd19c-7341-4ced-b006-7e6c30f09fd3 n=1 Tax=Sclerotinia trifoliorum TaxID=28548 RepID=A0A8H2ZPM3_9HELO|nr:e8efd19c-7341-4ced-b006-7e6c30f09fd3 [Sclerotinia trifoliorum]
MAWSKSTRILVMLLIDAVFFIVELGVGLWVGSLALMADAFHMLNDIISLAVGLWAVKAARRNITDKYSFGFLRAEILGAFFNAVFLIALCVSIVLEAVGRFFDPPEIGEPKLILIVGSLGLASNLAGFFVLGGHGHSHGPGDGHSHGDEVGAAEEGHAHSHTHEHGYEPYRDEIGEENGIAAEVFPEAVVAKATAKRQVQFTEPDEDASTARDSSSIMTRSPSRSSRQHTHRRRTSKSQFSSLDNISIHPASFRQDIIAASKTQLDGIDSEDSSEPDDDVHVKSGPAPAEDSPLLSHAHDDHSDAHAHSHDHGVGGHHHEHHTSRQSKHAAHNHNNKSKKSGGHGHNHDDMGMNAMILHVIGDALGNVGVIVTALIIWLTNWPGRLYADPAVSLFITIIILRSCIPLTKATAQILLQATPDSIDVALIKEDIENFEAVKGCHHVHIWQLSDSQLVASMHIQVAFPIGEDGGEKYMQLSKEIRECLHGHGIHSATLQPEFCLDKDHDHIFNGESVGLDGQAQNKCGMEDDDSCLLECVDNCKGKGCCSAQAVEPQHDHSDHDGHSH